MNEAIKFSIIVPIYKVELYLEQCVQSVLDQTYPYFELILVDDGSPDNCPYMCDRYAEKDNRVKVIHKKNGGLVSARQAGAALAKEEYIVCLDGDDWLAQDFLQKIYDILKNKRFDMVCFGYTEVYSGYCRKVKMLETGSFSLERIEKNIYPSLIEDENTNYFSHNVWSKIYRRELYVKQQLAVNPKIKIGEDIACTKPCIFMAKSIYIMEECLYYYRQNEESMTKNRKSFDWSGPMLIGKHLEKQIDMEYGDFRKQLNRNIVHNLFNVCISQFNRPEKYREIKKDIKEKISEAYYECAIEAADFKNWKGKFAKLSLKYKIVCLMKLYHGYSNGFVIKKRS